MRSWIVIAGIALSIVFQATASDARRTHLTPEQKEKLKNIQTVYVNVIALTESGRRDPGKLRDIVARRLQEIGYTVVTDRRKPHDVEFKVKCEERKTWTGTTPEGGDAELADAPARLWKGPACLFMYLLDGKDLGWYKEVRTSFEDAYAAAQAAQVADSGAYAMDKLAERLEVFDFPVLVTAEWGQVDRLLHLLDASTTHRLRKLKILSELTELQSDEALPHLTAILKQKDLAQEAIVALAGVGEESIPLLIDLFTTTKQPEIQAAAAKALGEVASSTGDPRTIYPLLDYLKRVLPRIKTSKDINFPVLTQVVWSLGKLRDDKSMEPIEELNEKVWLIYDNSKEMAALREATNWTYKQLHLDEHIS
ncbi:MAG: HEAT repeat domain-containing protein [Nitrospirae bacterium]|nr:MAG: HEAT repeat domain-containing protein [Nitrospirota bacterium]